MALIRDFRKLPCVDSTSRQRMINNIVDWLRLVLTADTDRLQIWLLASKGSVVKLFTGLVFRALVSVVGETGQLEVVLHRMMRVRTHCTHILA